MRSRALERVHFSHSWDVDLHSCVSQNRTACTDFCHNVQWYPTRLQFSVGKDWWEQKTSNCINCFCKAEWVCNYLLGIHRKKQKNPTTFWLTLFFFFFSLVTPFFFSFPPCSYLASVLLYRSLARPLVRDPSMKGLQ